LDNLAHGSATGGAPANQLFPASAAGAILIGIFEYQSLPREECERV